jgi:(E)-4-hydroxy-3-methylbut-2-enyl-diphosphate synthase
MHGRRPAVESRRPPPTFTVTVGAVQLGGGAPVVVQAMCNTSTADAKATAAQALELARAGAELVRFTVNDEAAARAVPEIRRRLHDAGCAVPLIGDFHYNGHLLLARFPQCARLLDKYRINPGNVGAGAARDERFAAICRIAREQNKPVRIGVNSGSLNQDLLAAEQRRNAARRKPLDPAALLCRCMLLSALQSTELALDCGLRENQIVISCKHSLPLRLVALYRELARRTRQPLHLGLTEAGLAPKGLIWSAAPLAILLAEGIGDTIRVSLTPRPGEKRTEEVYAAWEVLQALELRHFLPTVIACPGCGRTSNDAYLGLAEGVQEYVRRRAPIWRARAPGVSRLKIAVMGCVVNGPGESKAANLGLNLPGRGEKPAAQVYEDGVYAATLSGSPRSILSAFCRRLEDYVARLRQVRIRTPRSPARGGRE